MTERNLSVSLLHDHAINCVSSTVSECDNDNTCNVSMFDDSFNLCRSGIHFVHLNIQHLYPKLDEVRDLLTNRCPVDICAFTETFLNSSYTNDEIAVNGYSIYRKDRSNKGGGGIIIYVAEHLNVEPLDIECDNIESCWINIRMAYTKNINVGIVYRPPPVQHEWIACFESQLSKVRILKTHLIIMGDFNVNLCSNSYHSVELLELMHSFNLKQIIGEPTRVTASTATLLDHVYVSNEDFVLEHHVPKLSLSDHYPTVLTWKRPPKETSGDKHVNITYRKMKNFQPELFKKECMLRFQVKPTGDVNAKCESFVSLMLELIDKHAPERKKNVSNGWYNLVGLLKI